MRLLNEDTAYRNSNELLSMLIDNYSNELDSYKFDSIITDMSSPKNKFIDELCTRFNAQPENIYMLLIEFVIKELGFTNTVNNLLTYNYRDTYDNLGSWLIFMDAKCKEKFMLTRKTFPKLLFSKVNFYSDVILDIETVPELGFKLANFKDSSKLIVKDGCKEIKSEAFSLASCDDIYLPSSLTKFEYSNLIYVKSIHYAGTKSEFTNILDVSGWWDEDDSVGCDVYCTDGRIPWDEVQV